MERPKNSQAKQLEAPSNKQEAVSQRRENARVNTQGCPQTTTPIPALAPHTNMHTYNHIPVRYTPKTKTSTEALCLDPWMWLGQPVPQSLGYKAEGRRATYLSHRELQKLYLWLCRADKEHWDCDY